MSEATINEETPLSMVEVQEELKKIKKRDTELNFRAKKTEEYLNAFVTIKPKDAEELVKKLGELKIPQLNKTHILKLVDMLPATGEEVAIVLQGYTINVKKDDMEKIAAAIKGTAKTDS